MIISEADAIWAADKFIDYFKNFKTIEDYLRNAKNEAIGKGQLCCLDFLIKRSF